MSWKSDVIMKIEALNESVEKNKFDLGEHVDKLEGGEKSRGKERNILLQRAFKRTYDYLNNVDKKMMATIKTDAYDTTRQLEKVQRELKNLLSSVTKADESQEGAMKGLLHKLQADNFNIDVDSVTSMCNVSVGCNVLELEMALVRAVSNSSGIYLKNDTFDLKMLVVKVADSQTKHRLGLSGEEYAYYVISSQVGFPQGILKNMTVNAVAAGDISGDGIIPVLNSTVAEMKENNQIVADGINAIVLKIKRPSRLPEANVWLTVSLFKTVLRGCPSLDIVRSGLNSADLADLTATAKEQLNGTIFCDLDDENLRSLDLPNSNFADQGLANGVPSSRPTTAIQSNDSWPAPPSAKSLVRVLRRSNTNGNSSSEESAIPTTAFQSNGFRPAPPSATATSLGRVPTNGIYFPRETAMPATAMQSNGWRPAEATNLATSNDRRPVEAEAPNLAKYNGWRPAVETNLATSNGWRPAVEPDLATSNGWRPAVEPNLATSNGWRPAVETNLATSNSWRPAVEPDLATSNGWRPAVETNLATSNGWRPAVETNLATSNGWRPAVETNLAKYTSITVSKVNTNNNSPSIRSSKAGGADIGAKKVPHLSGVREVTGEAEATMPFSPKPDQGMVSTLRPAAMAGKLNGALSEVKGAVEVAEQNNEGCSVLGSSKNVLPNLEDIRLVAIHNTEADRVLGASKNVLPNVEEMQKSLSSTECSREDDSMHLEGFEVQEIALHNRSVVSFARKTNIVHDSITPQVGSPQPRFTIEEGNTKVTDGQAGGVKRLAKERDDGDVNDTEVDSDDPHLYLNASKAPSPTLANQTLPCDPAWDEGSGAVHVWAPSPAKAERSFASKVGMSDKSKMEMSVWDIPDEDSPRDIKGFNLALGLVDQIAMSGPGVIGGGKFCMQSPVHIEYVPSFSKFLISEPEYNRIGVYSKGTHQFQGWFGGRNEPYEYPTSILYLDNGYLVVLERSKIIIYDKDAKLFQKISGRYNGLAKDPHGNFISTKQNGEDKTTFISVFGQKNGVGNYVAKGSFPMDVPVKDESKVRFLSVHAGKIYASDHARNSIYVVDMETGNLTTWALKFNQPCSKPCGLLLDDRGYVLVADSGNHRLIVLNGEGELFREISVKDKEASTPSDIVKVRGKGKNGEEEDHIVVTYTGSDGTDGRLVRFKCT